MERLMPNVTPLLMAVGLAMATTVPAAAQDQNQNQDQRPSQQRQQQQQQAQTPNPYAQPDDSWITIEGTVNSVTSDQFTLAYADGEITVEMDDADRDADAYLLKEGDSVIVTGRVDDDLFESTAIEASSVFVQSLGTYFYASAMDEEDAYSDQGEWWDPHHGISIQHPTGEENVIIRGTVSEIVDDEEFIIDRGTRQVTVEVDGLENNPLDDEGYQKIEAGDYVSVRGEVDYDLFEGNELEANSVITLWDANRTSGDPNVSQP